MVKEQRLKRIPKLVSDTVTNDSAPPKTQRRLRSVGNFPVPVRRMLPSDVVDCQATLQYHAPTIMLLVIHQAMTIAVALKKHVAKSSEDLMNEEELTRVVRLRESVHDFIDFGRRSAWSCQTE